MMAISDAPPLETTSGLEHRTLEMVERARSGDSTAFTEIVRIHEGRILSIAIQMGLSPADAQDVCQDVFLRVFRYLGSFRAGKNFRVWLWRIAVNTVYDALRKRRDRGEVPWEAALGSPAARTFRAGGLHLRVENADLCRKLMTCLNVLTKRERMIFVLRDLQDLETGEVARALRISSITVRRHGAAARRKLRKSLEALGPKKTAGTRSEA